MSSDFNRAGVVDGAGRGIESANCAASRADSEEEPTVLRSAASGDKRRNLLRVSSCWQGGFQRHRRTKRAFADTAFNILFVFLSGHDNIGTVVWSREHISYFHLKTSAEISCSAPMVLISIAALLPHTGNNADVMNTTTTTVSPRDAPRAQPLKQPAACDDSDRDTADGQVRSGQAESTPLPRGRTPTKSVAGATKVKTQCWEP